MNAINCGCRTFYFGGYGEFDTLCHETVTKIKEENQRNIIDNLAKLTDVKANLSAYIAKRDTMQENIKADNEKITELNSHKAELSKEVDELSKLVANLKEKKQNCEKTIKKFK